MNHSVPEEIWLWLNEAQTGPYPLREVIAMSQSGQVNRETMYFEPTIENWRPLADLQNEKNAERLAYLRDSGMPAVQIVAGGLADECPVCRELLDQIFPIAAAPIIPPEGCSCSPWCKAGYVASR